MNKKILTLVPFLLITIAAAGCSQNDSSADLVIYSSIYTAEEENNSEAKAIAIKDKKYIYVGGIEGAKAYIKEGKTQVIDRSDEGLIIPGCTEGHAHYFSGEGLNSQLIGTNKSYEELLEILESKYKNENIKQFVSFGWDTTSLTERRNQGYNFAKEIESKAPNIPVVLIDNTGHNAVCNETALRLGNLTKENPKIRGGTVYLDKNLDLSGYVGDQAVYYFLDKVITKPLNDEQYESACEFGMNKLLSLGFTNALDAFSNMYDKTGLYSAIKKFDEKGKLKLNFAGCYTINSYDSNTYKSKVDEVKNIVRQYSSRHSNPKFIKLFADGITEGGTGWIFNKYNNPIEGKEHGNIIWDKPELNAIVSYANSQDITIHAHTYGDAACNAALDAFVTSNLLNGTKYRNTLAHVRNITEEDKQRAASNDVAIAANLIWHTDYEEGSKIKESIINNIGEELYSSGYPMKSLINKGVKVSSSTDAPAAMTLEGNILNIIEVATTGIEPNTDVNPFNPSELLSVKEALKSLTIDGAWQLGLDSERGSIKVGKYADFVMLDTNILDYEGAELRTIHNAKIENTYFEGEKVYSLFN